MFKAIIYDVVAERRVFIMKSLKSKVSITLDEDIILAIKELAEEDDRSFSQYVNMVLRNWIKDSDKNTKQN